MLKSFLKRFAKHPVSQHYYVASSNKQKYDLVFLCEFGIFIGK